MLTGKGKKGGGIGARGHQINYWMKIGGRVFPIQKKMPPQEKKHRKKKRRE